MELRLVALLHAVALCHAWSGYVNDFDRPARTECGNNEALSGLSSLHSNGREDRKWRFSCNSLPGISGGDWDNTYTDWDRYFKRENNGAVITGMYSIHDNKREDRVFRMRRRSLQSYHQVSSCGWTSPNQLDGELNSHCGGKFVFGVESDHSNKKEDRWFKLKCCTINVKCNQPKAINEGSFTSPSNGGIYPSTTRYSCNTGYDLVGAPERSCDQSGRRNTEPRCFKKCQSGLRPNSQTTACIDNNECTDGSHKCHSGTTICANTWTTYECNCIPNFYFDDAHSVTTGPPLKACSAADVVLEIEPTNSMLQISLTRNIAYDKFQVNVQQWNPSQTIPTTLFGYPRDINRDFILNEIMLPAGTSYLVTATPYRGANLEGLFKQSKTERTLCGCGYNTVNSDYEKSGAPQTVIAVQDMGMIQVSWQDNSRCEEAFAFTRKSDNSAEEVSFIDDYYYISEEECKMHHDPNFVRDDLSISQLSLGTSHSYCVRAVAEGPRGVKSYHSEPACSAQVQLAWEATVEGKITLSAEAGSLPVADVTVSWSVDEDPTIGGTQMTDGEGHFSIHIKSIALDQLEAAVIITFSKRSGNTIHKFLCHGLVQCTSKTMIVKHMTFAKDPLIILDDTSVPFAGQVTIGGTLHSGVRCPLLGVQVCLHEFNTNEQLACTMTTHTGDYSLPAVIGTLVIPRMSYKEHTFEAVDAELVRVISGYDITSSALYERADFIDVTTETLTLEVVGGKCDRLLGKSTITLGRTSCPYWHLPLSLEVIRRSFIVPAQALEVKIVSVVDAEDNSMGHVINYFGTKLGSGRSFNVDLSEVEELDEQVNQETDESGAGVDAPDPRLVRFEFHPSPTLSLALSGSPGSSCDEPMYVVASNEWTTATVTVVEKFGGSIPSCDWVEGDVLITNHLGETLKTVGLLEADNILTAEQRDGLAVCRGTCALPMEFNDAESIADDASCAGWRLLHSAWNDRTDETAVVMEDFAAHGQFNLPPNHAIRHSQLMLECGTQPNVSSFRQLIDLSFGGTAVRNTVEDDGLSFLSYDWEELNDCNSSSDSAGYYSCSGLYMQRGFTGITTRAVWSAWTGEVNPVPPCASPQAVECATTSTPVLAYDANVHDGTCQLENGFQCINGMTCPPFQARFLCPLVETPRKRTANEYSDTMDAVGCPAFLSQTLRDTWDTKTDNQVLTLMYDTCSQATANAEARAICCGVGENCVPSCESMLSFTSYFSAQASAAKCGGASAEEGTWARVWALPVPSGHSIGPEVTFESLPAKCTGAKLVGTTEHYVGPLENAHVDLRLFTGVPEQNPQVIDAEHPHTKLLKVSMAVQYQPVTAEYYKVVVIGHKLISKYQSVPFPEYQPLLVVRDPPGGLSTAHYDKMKTRVTVDVSDYEVFQGAYNVNELGTEWGTETETCLSAIAGAGGGLAGPMVAVASEVCLKAVKVKATLAGVFDHDNMWRVAKKGREHTKTLELSWSYTTTDNVGLTGQRADMFLVPALNIIFIETREIYFNATACKAQSKDIFTYDLDKGNNDMALSWLSYADIKNNELPRLRILLDDAKQKNVSKDIVKITEAVAGWEGMLAKHDQVQELAAAGNLTAASDLVHAGLVNGAKRLDGSTASEQDKAEISNIHTIKFEGGGSLLTIEEGYSETKTTVEDLDPAFNGDYKYGIHGTGETSFYKVGINVDISVGLHTSTSSSHERHETYGNLNNRAMGFTLGDPDAGDVFDVQVYKDPVYGTYVFHTTSGYSMCPHEYNTYAREQPRLQRVRWPSTPVFPDDPAIFELLLINDAKETTDFLLYTLHKDNTDGLDTGAVDTVYEKFPPGAISTVLEITRGPEKYKYEPITVGLVSLCENGRFSGSVDLPADEFAYEEVSLRVEFVEPCPTVKFAGALADDQTFTVNLETNKQNKKPGLLRVVAHNPEVVEGNWSSRSRLERVDLEYRPVGALVWKRAQNSSLLPIDAVASETPYGYSTLYWNPQSLPDGEYQLRLHSKCTQTAGATDPPPGLDESFSSVITGNMDRERPVQFGMSEPADNEYFPGDEIKVNFLEPVLCTRPFRFTLQLEVEGLQRLLNTRNLLVLCEGRSISVGLPLSLPYDDVSGRTTELRISGVEDLSNNVIATSIVHPFAFADVTLLEASVELTGLVIKTAFEAGMNNTTTKVFKDTAKAIALEIGKAVEIEASRIHVVSIREVSVGIEVDLEIRPSRVGSSSTMTASKAASTMIEMVLDGGFPQGSLLASASKSQVPSVMLVPSSNDIASNRQATTGAQSAMIVDLKQALQQDHEEHKEQNIFGWLALSSVLALLVALSVHQVLLGREIRKLGQNKKVKQNWDGPDVELAQI